MIEMLHMDCMDYMATCKDKVFELAIVDPPYGASRDEGFGGFVGFGGFGKPIARKRYKAWGDEEIPPAEYFTELLRVAQGVILWGGNFFTDYLPQSGHWIFWDKQNTMPTFGDGELAYTNFERKSIKRFVFQWNGLLSKEKEERIHATQKPVALYKWLLKNYAKQGDKILDTHGGSGSSAIACHQMGFDMVWMEKDKDYFDAAVKRFKEQTAQEQLFEYKPQVEQLKIL